jgi:uncharacterized protein
VITVPKQKLKSQKDILRILQAHRDDLTKLKVKHLALFGSFARGEQTAKSDVDLLVEFSERVDYFHFFDVQEFLRKILGRKVDLATIRAIRPEFQEQIEREQIRAA